MTPPDATTSRRRATYSRPAPRTTSPCHNSCASNARQVACISQLLLRQQRRQQRLLRQQDGGGEELHLLDEEECYDVGLDSLVLDKPEEEEEVKK